LTIKLTEDAAAEVKTYMEDFADPLKASDAKYLRVGVQGGGCSGFEYSITVGNENEYDEEKDILSHQHGVDVIVDKKSALYLEGTVLDYYTDISKRGFTFNNPNAVKSCGCGSSFQV